MKPYQTDIFKELRKCQNYSQIERIRLKFYPEVCMKDNNWHFLSIYNVLGTVQHASSKLNINPHRHSHFIDGKLRHGAAKYPCSRSYKEEVLELGVTHNHGVWLQRPQFPTKLYCLLMSQQVNERSIDLANWQISTSDCCVTIICFVFSLDEFKYPSNFP